MNEILLSVFFQSFPHGIEPWHVFITLIISVMSLALTIAGVMRSANTFRKSVLDELRVTRVSIRELLGDMAERNPEAIGRIVSAMNDETVSEFVRAKITRRKKNPFREKV